MHGTPVPKPHTGVDGVPEGAILGIAVVGAAVLGAAVLGAAVLGSAVGSSVVGSCVGVLVGIAVVGEAVGAALEGRAEGATVVGAEEGLQSARVSQHDTSCRDERLQGTRGRFGRTRLPVRVAAHNHGQQLMIATPTAGTTL